MASEEKILQVGEAQETPQAITITIVDPSALGSTSLDPSLVAQGGADQGSIVMVSGAEDSKAILQTVTETHMGTEELPIISNISNPEEEEMIVHETKLSESFDGGGEEGELGDSYEDVEEPSGPHCLVCNIDLTTNDSDEQVPVFKTQTSTTQRKVAVFLSSLIGQKVTSRKAHSDILCRRCFSLLDRVDSLEVEIRETKEEIINKYQETVSVYGGRARRIKPATAKKPDYVFPKVEPEDEADQLLDMELDGNFEPQVEDLMDEDPSLQDDDWEPKFKRPRIKKESTSIGVCESSDPPKRKRGRPRKDLTKAKGSEDATQRGVQEEGDISQVLQATPRLKHFLTPGQDAFSRPSLTCNSCSLTFSSTRGLLAHRCGYHCTECGAEEGSVGALTRHLRRCSSRPQVKTTSFSCKFCRVVFEMESQLQEHVAEHISQCLKQYSQLLKERGLAETPLSEPQPPLKKGRPRKNSDCPKCGLIYSSLSDLTRHLRQTHPDSLPHACRLCDDRFHFRQELEGHIMLHFLGSFKCDFCGIHFGLKYPFLRHLEAQHPGDFLLKCEFCEFTSASFLEYRQHRREPHQAGGPGEVPAECQHCDELVPHDELEEHIEEHLWQQEPRPVFVRPVSEGCRVAGRRRGRLGKKWPHCPECDVTFSSAAALSRHNHQQHPHKYSKQCDVCGHRFKGQRALELHREGHQTGRCWCPVCKLRFGQRQHVEQHFLRSHSDVTAIECEYCDARLASYSRYLYHCRTAHAELLEDRVELKCEYCDECLPNHVLLNQHMARYHGHNHQNAPKNMCPVCKKYFVHVDVHMNIHTRAVQFPCEECGEVFFMHSSLLGHRKVRHDNNAKTHLCNTCGKKFISSSLLRYHHEQVHLHKRQHCCEYCGSAYKSKSALTYHLKAHTGERPYKCEECGMGFHRPSTLKTHIEGTHHRPYPHLYRKPHRRAGAGVAAEGKEGEVAAGRSGLDVPSDIVEIDVAKSVIIGDEVGIEMSLAKDGERVQDGENVAEMVTVVEGLRDLSTLYEEEGHQDVYVIQALEDS
ncbi:zinc finger protein 99-like isoform X1 [Portunus trituberculatus]|uniref:zinc finger protein 99-like isoform X1 n=1 Tax=Portunus trituberculatus TaxID=210409 RepID=UPI001E1D0293|nr:zinc finger protein 99-like isoform X1 [Portunus trituberculatus]